eukprot:5610049-Amphidinium_carterae.2
MYAQTGMFSLRFQKQLMTYYDESIAYMCDTKEDYRKMQNHFEALDVDFGCPMFWKPRRKCEWIGADGLMRGL